MEYRFLGTPNAMGKCPICDKWIKLHDMERTYDCNGIPYRQVCPKCYDMVMEKGYDGERYDAWEENIEEDY